MSSVEAGGATVFPELNLSLVPQKGCAAVWYNLLPNGKGDERTRHAACPVLIGSKWGNMISFMYLTCLILLGHICQPTPCSNCALHCREVVLFFLPKSERRRQSFNEKKINFKIDR